MIFTKLKRASVFIILTFFLVVFVMSATGFYISIAPYRVTLVTTPADFGMPFERLTIKTNDGLQLAAWRICKRGKKIPARPAILLLHGYHSSKEDLLPMAAFLYPAFDVFMLDFRAHGESSGNVTTIGARELLDARSAIDFLYQKGRHKIGLYGFSMGGAVALQLSRDSRVYAIAADSPYASLGNMIKSRYKSFWILQPPLAWTTKQLSWVFLHVAPDEVSPEKTVKSSAIPVLILHAAHDLLVPVSHALRLKEALKKNKNASVWIVNVRGHGTLHPALGKEYEKHIINFFRRTAASR